MHAKQGGYAVQRRYRAEGRNPAQKATVVRLAKQGHTEAALALMGQESGLPPSMPLVGPQLPALTECIEWRVSAARVGGPPMVVRVGNGPRYLPREPDPEES
jgi:hypothetical protein